MSCLTSTSLLLAVKSLAESLNIDESRAQFYWANAFGSSWQNLEFSVKSGTSRYQRFSEREVIRTVGRMVFSFINDIGVSQHAAERLVRETNPLTNKRPRPIKNHIRIEERKTVTIADILREFNFTISQATSIGGDEPVLLHAAESKRLDFDSFARLYGTLQVSYFYEFYAGCYGWPILTKDLNDDYEMGSPSFYMLNDNEEEVPVLLFPHTTPPAQRDEMDLAVMAELEERFDEMLILYGAPCHKEVDGALYITVGRYYANGYWSFVLLCDVPPSVQHSYIGRKNPELESPALPDLFQARTRQEFLECYSWLKHGIDDNGRLYVDMSPKEVVTESGWHVLVR